MNSNENRARAIDDMIRGISIPDARTSLTEATAHVDELLKSPDADAAAVVAALAAEREAEEGWQKALDAHHLTEDQVDAAINGEGHDSRDDTPERYRGDGTAARPWTSAEADIGLSGKQRAHGTINAASVFGGQLGASAEDDLLRGMLDAKIEARNQSHFESHGSGSTDPADSAIRSGRNRFGL
ncbi:hypothetical protein [Acidipropionibacterium jensenii]|uniref:hypothetical protein n=1 Tax=Acidipropionibacterium jensenii TaxID=1749 RepID=UPI002648FBB0|nr:hypothetical protein [Acidipropionibacterium jensenii]MDN6556519.1 hypothetical protein [Acidipropionibacterium acidipropionici]MDN5978105.1 hypothetical protein [Acidipropionibacterium jensenii]MDN5997093.1 hypothetical protein [Acidipropionibacterium jensenii]MDN6427466.1 hypothetical protein [Acidipropionibacterium jensenii]MDN6481078.1 hypothetical protein [Acidipropionibacterium jensenii]